MIDWDNERRQVFKLALQKAYTDYDDLDMFVDEALDVPLADIAPKEELGKVAFKLLRWAKAKGKLDELFEQFCQANPQEKDALVARLQPQPLVSRSSNLDEADWKALFGGFDASDTPYLQIAFRQAFQTSFGHSFETLRPDRPALTNLNDLQELLGKFDCPTLAVRFVERVTVELRRSGEGSNRDLSALEAWRDRIAQSFNVPAAAPPAPNAARHAYLLVALEAHGSDVNLYPELRVSGVERPLGFGACPKTCTMAEAATQISDWIHQAEAALEADTCDDGQVTLEVFLPCQYLDEDIATNWRMQDSLGREVELGSHRWFLVRSLERVRNREIRRALEFRWKQLETCEDPQALCSQFHRQDQCPTKTSDLTAILKAINALGLKFVAQLPTNADQRLDLFYDIILSAVPIALWMSEPPNEDIAILDTEFDALLSNCQWTNFADLARNWQFRRLQSPTAKPIRLLCDRPDRLPHLPDPSREEDLLVAL